MIDSSTIAHLRKVTKTRRLCGVCLGLSPSWDGHDYDCEGRLWELLPELIDQAESALNVEES